MDAAAAAGGSRVARLAAARDRWDGGHVGERRVPGFPRWRRKHAVHARPGCDPAAAVDVCRSPLVAGSPADRADLEVGDEILEVNGRSLDDCSHNEVISHIHQCIRSRTVCLRVRRRPRLGEKQGVFTAGGRPTGRSGAAGSSGSWVCRETPRGMRVRWRPPRLS